MARRRVEGQVLSLPVVSRHGIFFWCGRVLVQMRYTFILVTLLIAASRRPSVSALFVWLVAVTLGVLLHELGHAWMARHYSAHPTIELYTLGGQTSWAWTRGPQWTWIVACSLAGPGISIVLGLFLGALLSTLPGTRAMVWPRVFLYDLYWVSFGWSFFNLLPILPLDGAAALEAVLAHRWGADRARRRMRVLSLFTGLIVAILAVAQGMMWAAILCLMFAYNNAQAMRGLPGVRVVG